MTTDFLLTHIPPQSMEAEQSTLGSMILDRNAVIVVKALLVPLDFYPDSHRLIYRGILRLHEKGKEIDVTTLGELLDRAKLLEKIGGVAYLCTLIESTPTPEAVESYARIVREKAILRRLVASATEIMSDCYESDKEPEIIVQDAENAMQQIVTDFNAGCALPPTIQEIGKSVFTEINYRIEQGGGLVGLSTGFDGLDHLLCGLRKGELTILGARPAVGKTSLALQIGDNMIRDNKRILMLSQEMSARDLYTRLLAQRTGLPGDQIQRGKFWMNPEDAWSKLISATEQLHASKWIIDDTPGQNVEGLCASVYRHNSKLPVDAVIMDYVQLVRHDPREQRYRAIGRVALELLAVAKKLNIPVILISQLGREVDKNARGGKPTMSNLRESGDLENHAAAVLLLHRPALAGESDEPIESMSLILAKNRFGSIGIVDMEMNCAATSFKEV